MSSRSMWCSVESAYQVWATAQSLHSCSLLTPMQYCCAQDYGEASMEFNIRNATEALLLSTHLSGFKCRAQMKLIVVLYNRSSWHVHL